MWLKDGTRLLGIEFPKYEPGFSVQVADLLIKHSGALVISSLYTEASEWQIRPVSEIVPVRQVTEREHPIKHLFFLSRSDFLPFAWIAVLKIGLSAAPRVDSPPPLAPKHQPDRVDKFPKMMSPWQQVAAAAAAVVIQCLWLIKPTLFSHLFVWRKSKEVKAKSGTGPTYSQERKPSDEWVLKRCFCTSMEKWRQ